MAKSLTLFLVTGLSSFTIYILTLAPTITWRNDGGDSGDLAAAIAVNGVPHPSGYPTYLLLGQLFRQLPFSDLAYRLNLLSATSAALAVAILAVVIFRSLETHTTVSRAWLCAISAALLVAFSPPFWSQAVITEVYTLTTLFATLLLYVVLQIPANKKAGLVLILAGLLGLSLGNHLSILLFFPMLIPLVQVKWSRTLLLQSIGCFLLGLSVYLIIPWRAAALPPINWGGGTTWSNFVWLVSAAPYHHFLFSLPPEYIPIRIVVMLRVVAEAFLWLGLPLGLWGWLRLKQADITLAWRSLGTVMAITIYAIGYNTTDSYVYLLPALLIFALWLGWGLTALLEMLPLWGTTSPYPQVSLLLLPLLALTLNFSNQNISHDQEALHYARQRLEQVAPAAIIIVESDQHTFALWYGRYGLALRPDVAIVNSNLLSYTWYRQTLRKNHPHLQLSDQANQASTPLQHFVDQNYGDSPIYLEPLQSLQVTGYNLEIYPNNNTGSLVRLVQQIDGDK